MKIRFGFIAFLLLCVLTPNFSYALNNNTFSAGLFLGDSYAPNNVCLSFGNVDVGISDISNLYVGSRKWLDNYFAGFGFGVLGSVYGMVGHEWRFLPWMGLSVEFVGSTSYQGDTAGRGYFGIVAGW